MNIGPANLPQGEGFSIPDGITPDMLPPEPERIFNKGMPMLRFPDGSICADDNGYIPNGGIGVGNMNHGENLADTLPFQDLVEIGMSLKKSIDDDLESQEAYFQGVKETVEELGLKPGTQGGSDDLPFGGASNVNSTALWDALNQFVAWVRQYLYRSQGMVDTTIVGAGDEESEAVADRMKKFFNYFLTYECKEFRKESIRTVMWAGLAGSAYKKVYIDPVLGRPTSMFIPIDDFIVNRSHATHHAAIRKTHRLRLSDQELQIRRMRGIYRDVPMTPLGEGDNEDDSGLRETLNAISGYEEVYSRGDDEYLIYESHVELNIKGDPAAREAHMALPYIISLDAKTGTVLGVYRNWHPGDPTFKKIEYFVNFSLFPSLDGEGYGFTNYAARLSKAATELTRQLINAGMYSNFPGGIIQGGIRLENNTITPAPGQYVSVMTGGQSLSDAIKPLPYGEPSQALHGLRNEIEDAIKRPCMIVTEEMTDLATRAPQGTVMFLMEQMHKVPNSLMQNVYQSLDEELNLLKDRLGEWLPADRPYPFAVDGGDQVIMKADFSSKIKVFPCSDPSLPNSSYRMLQAELIMQTAEKYPQMHNQRAVLTYYYENLGLSHSQVEEFVVPDQPPAPIPPLDPVTENSNILNGQGVNAGIDQDHDAHIMVHSQLITHPDPTVASAAQAHMKQHEAMKFTVQIYSQIGQPIPEDPTQLPPEVQNQIAVMAAQVVQQTQAQQQPQGPTKEQVDMAQIEAGKEKVQMEVQMKLAELEQEKEKMRIDAQLEEAAIREKESASAMRLQLEQLKFEHEKALKEVELRMKMQEMTMKEKDEVRKQDKHIHELTQPTTKGD